MELRLDLHIHSERSFDGCMSLSEIVALARERGLNGVAICDHDRVLDEVRPFTHRAGWRSSRIPLSTAQTRTGSTM